METWGATVHRSPSRADRGRALAGRAPDRAASGSRSPRRSRSRPATTTPTTRSARCSTTCCLHQTVIGQEAIAQMELAGEYPDVVDRLRRRRLELRRARVPVRAPRTCARAATTRFVAAEPAACPTLTRGVYRYDFGDTVGHDAADADVHARPRLRAAAGARRRAALPRRRADRSAALVKAGLVEARAYRARTRPSRRRCAFARTEGIIPAPEPAHAIRAVIDEAEAAKRGGRGAGDPVQPLRPRPLRHVRLRRLPGRRAEDLEFSEEDMQAALERLPEAPVPA